MDWSTLEKEAFAILATVDRMHWLPATSNGFDRYTEHHKLVFLFDALAVVPDLSQTSLRKVLRWAVRLGSFNYTCIHILGVDNVWAGLLSRWTVPVTVHRIVSVPVLPSSSSFNFEWPPSQEIKFQQSKFIQDRLPNLGLIDGLWKNSARSVWIPDGATDLQLHL